MFFENKLLIPLTPKADAKSFPAGCFSHPSGVYIIVLKILINKNNNRWLFINKYSSYPDEFEVLIKRNSLFLVHNVETIVADDNITPDYEIKCSKACNYLFTC